MTFRNTLVVALVAGTLVSASSAARANVVELQPASNIPAGCSATPVYGSDTGPALPWIDAQPVLVSHIRLTMTHKIGPHGTYVPLAARGEDVLIRGPSHSVTIDGRRVNGPPAHFSALLLTGAYQRLNVPTPGCWELQLTAGSSTGSITVWVRPEP